MDPKIEKLCDSLESTDWQGVSLTDASQAANLLRAYDALAEFAEHGANCLYGVPHTVNGVDMRDRCDCGLLEAQRRVAELVEKL